MELKEYVEEIAQECANELMIGEEKEISIDEVWEEIRKETEIFLHDVRDVVEDILDENGINVKY